MKGILLAIGFFLGVGFAAVSDNVLALRSGGDAEEPAALAAAPPDVEEPEATPLVEDAVPKPRPIAIGGTFLDERQEVLEYHRQSARKGNAQAQYAMGLRYLGGIDVPKNETLAMDYLNASRNGGEVRARDKITEVRRIKRQEEEKRREVRELAFMAEVQKFESQFSR